MKRGGVWGLVRLAAAVTAGYELSWAAYNSSRPGRVPVAHIHKEILVGSMAAALFAALDL